MNFFYDFFITLPILFSLVLPTHQLLLHNCQRAKNGVSE